MKVIDESNSPTPSKLGYLKKYAVRPKGGLETYRLSPTEKASDFSQKLKQSADERQAIFDQMMLELGGNNAN